MIEKPSTVMVTPVPALKLLFSDNRVVFLVYHGNFSVQSQRQWGNVFF